MSTVLDLSEGAIFAQQFRVLRPLAKGGMGAVYVVEQLGTKRERALKLMHPMLVSDERSRERFEREAQVASRIESDHVVEVIGAGVEPHTSTPWLCMELLKGEELGARMARGPLGATEVLEVVKQLGHALGAAHRAGIVHRDLKPENLFLATPRREGVPFNLKVLDFGVAALVHEASGKSTATQGVGSPLWMAPEQTNVGNVRPATDVWAVGLLAYHFLTGGFYWKSASTEGSTLTALLVEVMVEPLVPASARAAEQGRAHLLPRGFDGWFSRCVARNPDERFSEAGAALAEVVSVLTGNTPSMAPGTQPQAFAATAFAGPTAPLGGATGPPATPSASGFPATGAALAPAAPTQGMVSPAPPIPVAPPRAARARWPWVLAAFLGGALLCGLGVVYSAVRGAERLAAVLPSRHLDIEGDHGERVSVTAAGVTITGPDGGILVATDEDGEVIVSPVILPPTPVPAPAVVGPRPDPGETETEDEDESDAETDVAGRVGPRRPRGRARGGGDSTGDVARRLRARLDRCVEGNLAGEPPARWTFELRFSPLGLGAGARIVGPHAGETSGGYRIFRACVQTAVLGFDSGGDPGPFALTLP